MLELAKRPKRRGCPWMYHKLRREGFMVNHKRVERIYREEGMKLPRRKRYGRRAKGGLIARPRATRLDEIWSADFIEDSTWTGRRFRTLNLLDEFGRVSIDAEVAGSITGQRVRRLLDRAIEIREATPEVLVVDNGPEFICNEIEA